MRYEKDKSKTSIPRWCIYCKEKIELGEAFVVVEEGDEIKEYHVECYKLLHEGDEELV